MNSASQNRSLTGRTILVSPDGGCAELASELEHHGARVLTWPRLVISDLKDHVALDEAIGNLFGYDWLIFRNVNAVECFLQRLQKIGHEISELDALRVCGVGEPAVHKLEASQVHVDVISGRLSSQAAFGAIEIYVGGGDALRGLNFLIPVARDCRDYLFAALPDAGARVDLVTTYRTCAPKYSTLTRTDALLTGGGIDCIAFTTAAEVSEFAAVFDTNDLGRLLAGVAVACGGADTVDSAGAFALTTNIVTSERSMPAFALAIALYLSR